MLKHLGAIACLLLISSCHHGHGFDFGEGPCDDERGGPKQPPRPAPDGRGPPGGRGPDGGPGGPSSRSDAGAGGAGAGSAGYCTSDVMCGTGLVCDRQLGACARPRGGCGAAAFQPVRAAGEMALVLDRSNSMREATPTGSKWTDLTSSIATVLARRSEVAWGLALFPASDAQACLTAPLQITPATMTAAAISGAISAASPTGSGTPTRHAVEQAGGELLGSGRPTRKYLLLATDGEPNCSASGGDQTASDTEGTASAVRALAQRGLTTFVLGVAVHSASAAALSAMAQAGGHARQGATAYYTAGDAGELEAALDEVARQIALCTFELAPPPPAGATLTLSIGGHAFPRNADHVGDGWDITGAGRAIELYGAACDAIQAGAPIQVGYGCGAGDRCDDAVMACVPAGLP